jgi:TRAP-type C4-dicarboxylate transport system substrate-binding protein
MSLMRIGASLAMALTVGAVGLAGSACAGSGPDKAGGTAAPVVLRLANINSSITFEPSLAYFVARVGELSRGALRIEFVTDDGNYSPGVEQAIVRDVADGRYDLGAVGTRVFDTLGDRSFQALTAPMLIDSYPLESAVIKSGIPARMLSSLDGLGVNGLAILGGGLRKPIAVERPLLGPADWRGVVFAAFRSNAGTAAIRALGARPTDAWGSYLSYGLNSGKIRGFEKSLLVYRVLRQASEARYVTANLNLWPGTVALVANPKRLAGLSGKQLSWLHEAAADTAAHSTALADHDARDARIACGQGARLVDSTPSELAAFRRSLGPVYARLERDPETKALIAEIEGLKRSTPAGPGLAIPSGCRSAPQRSTSFASASSTPVDGVYRVSWSEKELIHGGASRAYARTNHGVVTLTLHDGVLAIHYSESPPDCPGTYSVSGSTLSILEHPPKCQGLIVASWSVSNGKLLLRVSKATDPGDEIFWGRKPWTKIG